MNELIYLQKFEMFTSEDILILFCAIFFITILATVVLEIIYFIPSFMTSLLKSINNKSLHDIDDEALNTRLDLNQFKILQFKFFNKKGD